MVRQAQQALSLAKANLQADRPQVAAYLAQHAASKAVRAAWEQAEVDGEFGLHRLVLRHAGPDSPQSVLDACQRLLPFDLTAPLDLEEVRVADDGSAMAALMDAELVVDWSSDRLTLR